MAPRIVPYRRLAIDFAVWFLVSYLKRRSLVPFVVYRLLLALVIVLVVLRG